MSACTASACRRRANTSIDGGDAAKRARGACVPSPDPRVWAPPGWVSARDDGWGASTRGAWAAGVAVCARTRRVAVACESGVVAVWRWGCAEPGGRAVLAKTHELQTDARLRGLAWSPAGDGRLAVSGLGLVAIEEGGAPRVLWRTPPDHGCGACAERHTPAWLGPSHVAIAGAGPGAAWRLSGSGESAAAIRGSGAVEVKGGGRCDGVAVSSGSTRFTVWSVEGGAIRERARLRHGGGVQAWALGPDGGSLWAVDFEGNLSCYALGASPRRLEVQVRLPRPPLEAGLVAGGGWCPASGMRVMRLWVRRSESGGEVVVHVSTARGHLRVSCTREGEVRSRRFTSYGLGDWVHHAGPPGSGEVLTAGGLLEGALARPRKPLCVPFDASDAGAWGLALALRCGRGLQVWLRGHDASTLPTLAGEPLRTVRCAASE